MENKEMKPGQRVTLSSDPCWKGEIVVVRGWDALARWDGDGVLYQTLPCDMRLDEQEPLEATK